MPKFTLANSFRFSSPNRRKANIHSETIERLLKKLSSDELRLFARREQIHADLMGWKRMVFKINDVLDDAMKLQATNQSVNMWLAKLPNLAYDVEALLDEFQTEASQRPVEETSQARTSRLCDSMVMSKVKDVNARFQDIASQIVLLDLKSTNVSRRLIPTSKLMVAIIKISLGDRKSRHKALKTAIRVSGVKYVEFEEDDEGQLEVRGDGVDPVAVLVLLRKKVGFAELLSASGSTCKYKRTWVVKFYNFIKRVR